MRKKKKKKNIKKKYNFVPINVNRTRNSNRCGVSIQLNESKVQNKFRSWLMVAFRFENLKRGEKRREMETNKHWRGKTGKKK